MAKGTAKKGMARGYEGGRQDARARAIRAGLCAVFLFSGAAQAAEPAREREVAATYAVYAGGIRALTAELDIKRTDGTGGEYALGLASRTTGFVRFLAPWRGTLRADGAYRDGLAVPRFHESIAVWTDNTHVKRMTYAPDGTMESLVVTNNGTDESPAEAKVLMDGTIDVMTAALRLMDQVARDGTCAGKSEGFDGKRRYALVARDAGREEIKPGRYSVFSGTATACTVAMEPRGGDWHEKLKGWAGVQEDSQKQGGLPTVWLARLSDGGPVVPVRIRVRSGFGAFMVHLTGYRDGTLTLPPP